MSRLAVACLILTACGGQTSADVPPSSSDFPEPSPDAVPYDDRVGALANVTGGRARVGGWWFVNNLFGGATPSSLDITPLACAGADADTSGAWPFGFGAEVIVAPFALMTTEVTNQGYAVCVDSGACAVPDIPRSDAVDWRSPLVVHQPAVVTWSLARAFCRHYGGDLPTAGEYARATVGDAETYAQPAVLSLVLACALSPGGSECDKLQGFGPLADVGTDPNDVGAFGHFDLYGNAWEWVRGYFDEQSTSFCSTPLYEHDVPLTFPDSSANDASTFPPNAIAYSPERSLGIPPSSDVDHAITPDLALHDPQQDVEGPSLLGFRCAFPTP